MPTTFETTVETPRASALLTHTRRRSFLARALGLGAGALTLAASEKSSEAQIMPVPGVNDAAILNFALNFEYLGSEYYTFGLTGMGIAAQGLPITGIGTPGATITKANPVVPFATPLVQQFFTELARDEQAHVITVRSGLATLGAQPIAKPEIDLLNSFNLASQLAGLGATFDPYANETNFLIGAYILEDTCVTALRGAAPLIVSKAVLNFAAGLLGVESYQAGAIRTLLNQRGMGAATEAISTVRATASHNNDDFGVAQGPLGYGPAGSTSIVLADRNAIAFARNFRQVLNIAYLSPNDPASGGFFPQGVNGPIQG